jgi:hypothetical protein
MRESQKCLVSWFREKKQTGKRLHIRKGPGVKGPARGRTGLLMEGCERRWKE